MEIKTSGDFDDDPEGAMDALDQTGIAIFYITRNWHDDPRAQKEWRYACEIEKPMIYILGQGMQINPWEYKPNVIATIHQQDDTKHNAIYLEGLIAAFIKIQEQKNE